MRLVMWWSVVWIVLSVMPLGEAQGWGACATQLDNLLATENCDFSDGTNGWTFSSVTGTWTTNVSTGYPTAPSGSAEAADPSDYSFSVTSTCRVVSGNTDYAVGVYAFTPGGADISCSLELLEYEDGACANPGMMSLLQPFVPQVNTWTPYEATTVTANPTGSARLRVGCSADASFTVLLDNASVVEGTSVPVVLQSFSAE